MTATEDPSATTRDAGGPVLPGWARGLVSNLDGVRIEGLRAPRAPASGGRPGAVLILLGEDAATGPFVVIIERAATLRNHAGQCAFPGGGVEPGDDGPAGTALRESAEEIGLLPDTVEVIATLPPLWLGVSGFLVTPVVGWWRAPHPVTALDPGEVARVASLPVAELADPAHRFRVRHPSGYVGPAFRVRSMFIWGFTGALVSHLLDLGGWSVPWDTDRFEPLSGP